MNKNKWKKSHRALKKEKAGSEFLWESDIEKRVLVRFEK